MPISHASLADLDLGKVLADTRESLAARLGFDEYVAVVHTLEADQVFWKGLLVGGPEDQGAALVLETRLGALSGGLSRHFKTVFAWHASARAAAITKQYVDRHQIHNIRIIISDPHEDLDVDGERFDAVVFYGPSQDMTGQWGRDATTLLKSLTRKIPLWLADDGVVVVGENNRCTYRFGWTQKAGDGHAGGIALPGLGRWLHKPRYLDLYLGSSPMTSSQKPMPDLTLRDAGVVSPMFPKNTFSSLKETVLHSRVGRLLWPSFLLIASDRPRRSFLQGVLEQRSLGEQAGWDGASAVMVKRILAGNSGTTVLIAGPKKDDGRDVIMRLPSKPSGRRFCHINAQALRKLAQTSLSGYVPRLLVESTHQDQEFTVESRCPGYEANYGTRNLDGMLRQACELMGALHRQTARPVTVTEAGFQEYVAPLIQDLANYCSPDVQSRFHRFMEALRIAMVGRTVSIGFMHGDFKLGNFLFDRTGKLTALIDWDGFSEDGYPVFDYLTLLVYKMAHENGSRIPDIYLQYLLPWKLPPACQRLVGDETSALLIDDESFLLMRIVFWFSLNYYRFDPLYKYHPTWQRGSVLPMLSVFEKIHQSGWRAS